MRIIKALLQAATIIAIGTTAVATGGLAKSESATPVSSFVDPNSQINVEQLSINNTNSTWGAANNGNNTSRSINTLDNLLGEANQWAADVISFYQDASKTVSGILSGNLGSIGLPDIGKATQEITTTSDPGIQQTKAMRGLLGISEETTNQELNGEVVRGAAEANPEAALSHRSQQEDYRIVEQGDSIEMQIQSQTQQCQNYDVTQDIMRCLLQIQGERTPYERHQMGQLIKIDKKMALNNAVAVETGKALAQMNTARSIEETATAGSAARNMMFMYFPGVTIGKSE